MRRLLSVIVSLVSVMTFAQKQSAELAPQGSGDMLRIGKSYLGTCLLYTSDAADE